MRHRVKKIKFKKGKDATSAVLRKLLTNFIKNGKLRTTVAKAKIIKSVIDRLVYKAKQKNEAAKNVLLKYLGKKEMVGKMLTTIASVFDDRNSGFVRIIKLSERLGDGSKMARVEWVKPVIEVEDPKLKVKNSKKIIKEKVQEKENEKSHKVNKTSKRKRS